MVPKALFDAANYYLNTFALPLPFISVIVAILAVLVFFKEGVRPVSVAFLLLASSIMIWLSSFFLMYCSSDEAVALWWAKTAYLGVPFIPAALYYFTVQVLGTYKRGNLLIWIGWAGSLFFSFLSLTTDFVIRGLYRYPWGFYPKYSSLSIPYLVFFFGLIIASYSLLLKSYREADRESIQYRRIRLFAYAYALSSFAVVDYLAKFGISIYPLGYLAVFASFIIFSMALTQYRLVDITPRFAAQNIMDTMFDSLFVLDADGVIRMINSSAIALLGLTEKELVGRRMAEFFKEMRDTDSAAPFISSQRLQNRELLYHNPLRGELTLALSASVMTDSQGRPLATVCVLRDITDAKKSALQLKKAHDEMEQRVEERTFELSWAKREVEASKAEYEHTVSMLSDVVWRYEADADLLPAGSYISPVADRMIGLPAGTIGNDFEKYFSYVQPEDRTAAREAMLNSLRTLAKDVSFKYRIVRTDGSTLWARSLISAYAQPGGRLVAFGTTSDITESKLAEEERLQMELRLQQAQRLESLGVLAGGIAHDFNNLLMAIQGNLELALMDIYRVDFVRERIMHAEQASERAADLTRQLLAYSGKAQFVLKNLNLSRLVEENSNIFRAVIAKTVTLELNLDYHIRSIMADPGQIQQVVMNLITNASEAIGDRPGIVTLTTGMMECSSDYLSRSRLEEKPSPGWFVYLEVTDTGCGMDDETQLRLFEPFFTTKFMGRGLGMSAVLGILRGHHGALLIDSTPDNGTAIKVLLPPADTEVSSPDGEARPSDAEEVVSAPIVRGKVLVVDDEEMVREVCATMLKSIGFKVLEASDGREAVEVFQAHSDEIICVILDLNMPTLDGIEAYTELCRIRPDIRVILSSGYNEQEALTRFSGQGFAGFIQKPYRIKTLRDILESAVEIRHDNV